MYVHVLVSFMFCSDLVCLCLSCLCSFCLVRYVIAPCSMPVLVCVCASSFVCVCVWAKSSNTSMWCPILKVGTCQLANIAGIHRL